MIVKFSYILTEGKCTFSEALLQLADGQKVSTIQFVLKVYIENLQICQVH